ncbi:MAG: hypothetical protein KDB03_19335 [Planctomycetales bacterium]|nr:hypothetical protein [Planctomycetales bacterium]
MIFKQPQKKLCSKSSHLTRSKSIRSDNTKVRRLFHESLEDRRVLAAVVVDPGDFSGDYLLVGKGISSGERTYDLEAGTYEMQLGNAFGTPAIPNLAASRFFFDVDAAGNVTSQAPVSATGIGHVLAFNTVPITVDPGTYSGSHIVASLGGRIYNSSGARTVNLVPGIQYPLNPAQFYWMTFDVDASGQVETSNPDAVSGINSTLSFNTATVNIEKNGYSGFYQIGGGTIPGFLTGSTIDLVRGVAGYDFRIGSSNTPILVDVDASGMVNSHNPIAVSSYGNTLTFQTTQIHIDTNGYVGRFQTVFVSQFNISDPILVRGLSNYQVAIARGEIAFAFDVASDGTVTSRQPFTASSSGNTLTFQTSQIRINPEGYLGKYDVWFVSGSNGISLQGASTVVLVNGHNDYFFAFQNQPGYLPRFGIGDYGIPNSAVVPITINGINYDFKIEKLVSVTLDSAGFVGGYRIATPSGDIDASGSQTFDLVPGEYHLGIHGGDANGFYRIHFRVEDDGKVVSTTPDSAKGWGSTLTFNTSTIVVDPGAYTFGHHIHPGIYSRTATAVDVTLIRGLSWNMVLLYGGQFSFKVEASGQVSSNNPDAATGIGNRLLFNTSLIIIDPRDFEGLHDFGGAFTQGVKNLVLVDGLSYFTGVGFAQVRFSIDGVGAVISNSPDSAFAVGNALYYKTTTLNISTPNYPDIFGIGRVASGGLGTLITRIVPGLANYRLDIYRSGQQLGSAQFSIDAFGNPAPATIHFTIDGTVYEFNLSTNSPPQITSPAHISIAENHSSVLTITALDLDPAQNVSFSIGVNGADDAMFLVAPTGQLSFTVLPDYETPLDADGDNIYEVEVIANDGNGGTDTQLIHVSVLNQASITGSVFVDVNGNSLLDANEMGIDGVIIQMLDAAGNPVLDDNNQAIEAITNDGGFYLFEDLNPGEYRLAEVQPSGVSDGAEILGSLGGLLVANDAMQLNLVREDATDYYFAEIGGQVSSGDTATIGFWQNKHGQNLIASGGTQLASWLTLNFGNVFGNTFSDGVGDNGAEVASFYQEQLFKQKSSRSAGPAKVDAQFMATALATFFTSSNLAGNAASTFGFNVSETGIGTKVVNVGSSGAAFGVADNSNLTILQLLQATNALTDQPELISGAAKIYDIDGDGEISEAEAQLRTKSNLIYSFINELGGI